MTNATFTAADETVNMDSIIRRLVKLLAMAEDGRGNAAEMNVAGAQAAKIMAKYNITRAQVTAAAGNTDTATRQAAADERAARASKNAFERASRDFAAQFYAAQAARAERARAQAARAAAADKEAREFAAKAAAATAERDAKVARAAARRANQDKAAAPKAEKAARPAAEGAKGVRSTVTVEGVGTFSSLLKAFEALSLPINKHIKFRAALKAAGTLHFGQYKFTNNA